MFSPLGAPTSVVAVELSLAASGSTVALATVAVFVSVPGWVGTTAIVSGTTAPAARVPSAQMTVVPAALQLGLEPPASKSDPGGSGSVTTASSASEGPALVTVS